MATFGFVGFEIVENLGHMAWGREGFLAAILVGQAQRGVVGCGSVVVGVGGG